VERDNSSFLNVTS
jgi:hypothetical protein